MSKELKPCPWCGEPANLCKQRFVSYDGSIRRCYWHVVHRCRHGNYAETDLCGTKTEAIRAWNRRAKLTNSERPKCTDLMDAIQEVRWWIGVNMARFNYSLNDLSEMMKQCLEFEKKYRRSDDD